MLTQVSYVNKHRLLIFIVVAGIIIIFCFSPIKQNTDYHQFADQEIILGIQHFSNSVSNILLFLSGLIGFIYSLNSLAIKKQQYYFFFSGLILTGLGSFYYHIHPNNTTLFWDRLPMTITFMSLFAIVIDEYLNKNSSHKTLYLLNVLGILSVIYWKISEFLLHEDLRPYVIIQFLPMILIPLILILFEGNDKKYIWWIIAIYGTAKLCESLDESIYNHLKIISGHTLKHCIASLVSVPVLLKIKKVKKTIKYR